MSEVAAFSAWLGAALIVLAEGRRGLAAGLVLLALAAAGLTWAGGDQGGAIVLLAGGVLGAALRFTIGAEGWGLMQPGSTPRLLLTVVVALVALWVALAATSGVNAGWRFAMLSSLALLGARLLQPAPPTVQLTAIAGVVLLLGAIAGGGGVAACAIAGLITAGVSAMPALAQPRGT